MSTKTQEIRLGVVMYGGVALAVYINGVSQELFRLIKGKGLYTLLKRLIDSDAVIDVISGTSAGGVNGVYLGYSLANGKDFAYLASLWTEKGGFRDLLHKPFDPKVESLLDSVEYYHGELKETFDKMPFYNATEREDVSEISELDLFVTGTIFDGKLSIVTDDRGTLIPIKDHRGVFHLKLRHPPGSPTPRKNDFEMSPGNHDRLALISRTTSAFPVAFEPTYIEKEKMETYIFLDRDHWFIDGGVLDNKPFTYTIKAIYHRPDRRRVDRKLFYIEPDPERFDRPMVPKKPDFVSVAAKALISLPSYESIASDIKLIQERNRLIQRYRDIFKQVRDVVGEAPEAPPHQRRIYNTLRFDRLRFQVTQALFAGDSTIPELDARGQELISASEKLIPLMKRDHQQSIEENFPLRTIDIHHPFRKHFFLIYEIYDIAFEKGETLSPSSQEIQELDRLRGLLYRQLDVLDITSAFLERVFLKLRETQAFQELLKNETLEDEVRLERAVQGFWRYTYSTIAHMLDLAEIATSTDESLRAFYQYLRDPTYGGGEIPEACITAFRNYLREKHDTYFEQFQSFSEIAGLGAAGVNLLEQVRSRLEGLLESLRPELSTQIYDHLGDISQRFDVIDAHLFPYEYLSGLEEKDAIELIRISPHDAQIDLTDRKAEDKVSGDTLAHFGGFLKRSWRANDILWGRLDAITILVDTLLTSKRLNELNRRPEDVLSAVQDYLGEEYAEYLQKPVEDSSRGRIARVEKLDQELRDQLTDADSQRVRDLPTLKETLLRKAYIEILRDELPRVIRDELLEAASWRLGRRRLHDKVYQRRLLAKARRMLFQFYDATQDTLLKNLYAGELEKFLRNKLGETKALAKFFEEEYKVGEEQVLRDIPGVVLGDMGLQAAMVMLNMMKNVIARRSDDFRFLGWLGRTVVNRLTAPVTFLYLIVRMLRTSGRRAVIVNTAFFSISVAFLILFFFLPWEGPLKLPILLVAPIVVLFLQYLYLSARLRSQPVSGILGLIILAGTGTVYLYWDAPIVQFFLETSNLWISVVVLVGMVLLGAYIIFLHRKVGWLKARLQEMRNSAQPSQPKG